MAEQTDMNLKMDSESLYREEIFTDRRVGTIQKLTPVDEAGQPDGARDVVFIGQTQLLTRAGPLPLSFEIAAQSLGEAADKFEDGAGTAVEDAVTRLEEMQQEAASSIIVPGSDGQLGGGAGGGKLTLP